MGTSALANPSTARSSASNNHALSPLRRDLRPSSGRAPLGSSKPPARVYRVSSGPARLLKQHAPVRVLRSLTGDGPPARFIDPAPGRPATFALSHRCAGFYGPQSAGPARESKLQARVHRRHSGPGLPASSNDLSQGSTPRSRGRPARTGSSAPHRVGLLTLLSAAPGSTVLNRPAPLGSSGCLLGFIGPTLGPARLLK